MRIAPLPRKQRLVFLGLCLGFLLAVGRLATGSFAFVLADLWFSSGLFLLLLLSVVDQPHFSTDSNVFLNGIAALLSLLTVPPSHRSTLWWSFLAWAMYLVSSSYLLMLKRTAPLGAESQSVQLVSR